MFNNAAGYDLVTGENPVNSHSSNGVCLKKKEKTNKDSEPQCTVFTVLPFVLLESPLSARGSGGGYSENFSLVSVPRPSGIDGPRGIRFPAQSRRQNPE